MASKRRRTVNPNGQTRRKLPKATRRYVFTRDDFECVYCGVSLFDDDGIRLHVDHVFPFVLGGTDDLANLATACAACNLAAGGRRKAEHIERPVLALIAARNAAATATAAAA